MSLTIDCGEGRHAPTCIGHSNAPYLFPQMAGELFLCNCWCHEAQVPKEPSSATVKNIHEPWMPEDDPDY